MLPDDRTVREKIAAREHAESAGIFDLLAVIGRDCVGALRFVPEGLDPGDPAKMEYRPVTDDEIAAMPMRMTFQTGPDAGSAVLLPPWNNRVSRLSS